MFLDRSWRSAGRAMRMASLMGIVLGCSSSPSGEDARGPSDGAPASDGGALDVTSADARADAADAGAPVDGSDAASDRGTSPDRPDAGSPDAALDRTPDLAPDLGGDRAPDADAADALQGVDAAADVPPPPPPLGQRLYQGTTLRVIGFSPDGDRLLFTTNTFSIGYSTIGDLWSWSFSRAQATHIETSVRWDTLAFVAGGAGLVYLKDGQSAGLVGDRGPLEYYDFASATSTTISVLTSGRSTFVSPDRTRVAYTDGYDDLSQSASGPLMVWSFADRAAHQIEAGGGAVRAWSPDSQWIAYFTQGGLQLWDVRQNAKTTASTMAFGDGLLVFSPRSDKVAFQIPLTVQVYDIAAKTTVGAPFDASSLDEITFSPDSSWLTFRARNPGDVSGVNTLALMATATGAVTNVVTSGFEAGSGSFGPFSPDGALLAVFAPTIGGKPVLHMRALAAGTDQTVAPNTVGNTVVFSDDGKQAAFLTNDGTTSAGVTLRLWSAASGQSRALTAAAGGTLTGMVTFVAGGARLTYLAFTDPAGNPNSSGAADLFLMDLASSTAVRLGGNVNVNYFSQIVSYISADGQCAVLMPGLDSAHMVADIAAASLTAALAGGATVLDHAANQYPIAVSARRVAYVIGDGVYASALPCAK